MTLQINQIDKSETTLLNANNKKLESFIQQDLPTPPPLSISFRCIICWLETIRIDLRLMKLVGGVQVLVHVWVQWLHLWSAARFGAIVAHSAK